MIRFSVFRIPVSIHWFFLLLIAFLGGITRVEQAEDLRGVAIFMVAAFISIMVHELGHALVGIAFGAPRATISLHSFGGAAYFWGHSFKRKHSILMTAAGPACSLLLCGLSAATLVVLKVMGIQEYYFMRFLGIMKLINLLWSIFNLLPILPLDGGRIVQDLLGPGRLRVTCIISFITLGIAGTALIIWTGSIFNLVIMLLLGSYTYKTWQTVKG